MHYFSVTLWVLLVCLIVYRVLERNGETEIYLKKSVTLLIISVSMNVHKNCKPHACAHVCTHCKPHIFWLGNFLLSNRRDLKVCAARFFAIFRE